MRGELNQFANFAAGLNSQNATYLLNEGQCRDCLNVNSTVRGAIQQRGGSQSFATHNATINSLFPFEAFVGGTTAVKYLIAVTDNGTIRAIDSNGSVGSSVASATASTPWDFAQFPGLSAPGSPGYLFACNGQESSKYWTGATQTTSMATWSNVNTATLSVGFVAGTNPAVLRFTSLPPGFGYSSTLTWPINGANPASPTGGVKVLEIDTSQGTRESPFHCKTVLFLINQSRAELSSRLQTPAQCQAEGL